MDLRCWAQFARRVLFVLALMLPTAAAAQSVGDLFTGIVRGATGLPLPGVGGPEAAPATKGKSAGTSGAQVYVCSRPVGAGNAAFAAKEGVLPGLGGGWGGVAERKDQEAKHCNSAALTSGLSGCKDIGYGCSECRATAAGGKAVDVVRGAGGALGRCPRALGGVIRAEGGGVASGSAGENQLLDQRAGGRHAVLCCASASATHGLAQALNWKLGFSEAVMPGLVPGIHTR